MSRGFDSVVAAKRLKRSIEDAIQTLTEEIGKPLSSEIVGAARKAELQSIKQAAIDCRELMMEHQRVTQMIKDLEAGDNLVAEKSYTVGFAEKYVKG